MLLKAIYKKTIKEQTRIQIRKLVLKLFFVFYLGNKYSCNCCGKSFRKMRSYGNKRRKNASCPYCFSLERTRVLDFYLQNETNAYQASIKLLHIAPEPVIMSKLKNNKNLNYISGDINPDYADYEIDITSIPFPDNYFDLIICSHVLGHIPEESIAIKELYRTLSTDGKALIMTILDRNNPHTHEDLSLTTDSERISHYTEHNLCRLHGIDFEKRLSNEGFTVEVNDYRLGFDQEFRKRYCLGNGDREIIYVCSK
jgi:SAM-dependent methyltransferase